MSIFDDMEQGQRVEYNPGDLSIDKLKEVFGVLYEKREPNRLVVIHNGIGGMYTLDYCLAIETGVVSYHMTKQHGKLMRMMGMGMNPGKVVDENGIVWIIGRVKGKGWYFSNMHQKAPVQRKRNLRFTTWEFHLREGLEPLRQLWTGKYSDTYLYYKERHDSREEAKHTGVRIKGTLTPDEGAMRRGY